MKYIFYIIIAILLGLFIITILVPFIWIFYNIVTLIIDKLDDWFGGWFE